jgi:hypothetical protein
MTRPQETPGEHAPHLTDADQHDRVFHGARFSMLLSWAAN